MQLQVADYKRAMFDCPYWQPIAGYEGLYEVHGRGVIRNAKTKLLLRPGLGGAGYLTVVLIKNGTRKTFNVHSLNADAHLPNPDNKRCINHKDGVKTNNHISNLQRVTHRENNIHAINTGLRKVKVTPEIISGILLEHKRSDKIFGARALAKKFGVNKCTIHEILNKYKYGNN